MQKPSQPRKARVVRGPSDGNMLWQLYSELGATARQELKDTLKAAGVEWWQFYYDSQAGTQVNFLPYVRVVLYQHFFGREILWEPAKPAARQRRLSATQQFEDNDRQPLLRTA